MKRTLRWLAAKTYRMSVWCYEHSITWSSEKLGCDDATCELRRGHPLPHAREH